MRLAAGEPTALYRIFGDTDLLLYIGISKRYGTRWGEHARTQPWWDEHRRMTVEWFGSRDEAHAAEVAAIGAEKPEYNVRHNEKTLPPGPQACGHILGRAREFVRPSRLGLVYTPEEAAPFVGRSPYWLRDKARKGLIPHTRLRRSLSFTPSQIAQIIRAGQHQPQYADLTARTPRRKWPAA